MKSMMTMAAVMALIAGTASAQVSFTGSAYTENFDSLVGQSGAFSATVGTQAAIPGLSTWQGAKIGGTGTAAMNMVVDAGGANSGALYSYGVASDPDRALGSLASGSNVPAFGVEIVNNASFNISEFTISFDSEAWRSSTTNTNVLAFAWGLSGGTITSTNFLSSTDMTALISGNVVGPAPVTTNGALNPPTVTAVSVTITGVDIAPGQSIFLRWQDANETGNDAGLAVDNFSFTAIPTPGSAALLGLGGLLLARRRRA